MKTQATHFLLPSMHHPCRKLYGHGLFYSAFSLMELLVVLSIITLLIALLLPVMGKARQVAIQIQCMSNLRGSTQGHLFYAADHKGSLPASVDSDGAWPHGTYVGCKRHYASPMILGALSNSATNPLYSQSPAIAGNPVVGAGLVFLLGYATNVNLYFCPGRSPFDQYGRVKNTNNQGQLVNTQGGCSSSYTFANCNLDGRIEYNYPPTLPFRELFNRWHNVYTAEGSKLLAMDIYFADWNNQTNGFDATGHDMGYNLMTFDASGRFVKDSEDVLQSNVAWWGVPQLVFSSRTGDSFMTTTSPIETHPTYRFNDGSNGARLNPEYWIQTHMLGWSDEKCRAAEPMISDTGY